MRIRSHTVDFHYSTLPRTAHFEKIEQKLSLNKFNSFITALEQIPDTNSVHNCTSNHNYALFYINSKIEGKK